MPAHYKTTCIECGAPRDPAAFTARCTEHQRAYADRNRKAHRARNPGYDAWHSRLSDYARQAQAAGAEGVEIARLAIACDIEHYRLAGTNPPIGWVGRFMAQELACLRASEKENSDDN